MHNIPKPFQKGKYYYFWLPMPDGSRKCVSTRETSKKYAKIKIYEMMKELEEGHSELTFGEYAEPFFTDRDPRIQWKRMQGKIGKTHQDASRARLERYVFTDEKFCSLPLKEITPRDCQQLFVRLEKRLGLSNTLEKCRGVISLIFNEAVENGDIPRNPMRRLGQIQYEKQHHTILTKEQLRLLFAEAPGVWGDELGYRVFLFAALTGMRMGEILALQWRQVDLELGKVTIDRAWKTLTEAGLPKWNKIRTIPLSQTVIDILTAQRESSIRLDKEDLVFCYDDGDRLGVTWWLKRFHKALETLRYEENGREKVGIDWKELGIKPHGFRHAVNTYALEAGGNPIMIDEYLGWSKKPAQLTAVQTGYTHPETWDLSSIPPLIERIIKPGLGVPQG